MNGPVRGAVLFGAILAIPGLAGARELQIDASPCAQEVRIHAQDVPIQEIVSALTNAMGVTLLAKTSLPDPVDFNGSGAPEDVLKRLLHDKNLVVETGRKPSCGARKVLAKVWLLPSGQKAPARPAAAPESNIELPGQVEFRSNANPLPPKFRRRGGKLMTLDEKRQVTQKLRDGTMKIDPETGELVAVTPVPATPEAAPGR